MEERMQRHELKEIVEQTEPGKVNKEFMDKLIRSTKSKRNIPAEEIAELILFLADFPDRDWDLPSIVESLKGNLEEVNWRDVYSCFLDVNFNIWTLESLYLIIDCWVYISGIITVPYEIFFKRWKNERAQIYFIRLIIESDEKRTQLYSNVFFRRIITLEESKNYRLKNVMNYETNFNCVELFHCISMLESTPLIELIAKKSPEWCVVGLAFIQPYFSKVFEDLLLNFIKGPSNSFVLYVLFKNHPNLMLHKVSLLLKQGISLSKILDILLEQKMLPLVSEVLDPYELCFDILVLSSIRDHLNLSIWLSNSLTSKKDSFVKLVISYLKDKVSKDLEKMFPLTPEIIMNFIKAIEQFLKFLRPETVSMFNDLKYALPQNLKLQKNKEMKIEEEASGFISQIINSQSSIEESVDKVKEYVGGDTHMRELANKIFSTLSENYNTLYKLPNSDLIALFYGGLIKKKILPRPYQRIALEYIKGSLQYPECDREYFFGLKCLEVFLPYYPSFLAEIEDIESVKNNLVKKELVLVDSSAQAFISFRDLIKFVYKNEIEKVSLVYDKLLNLFLSETNLNKLKINNECTDSSNSLEDGGGVVVPMRKDKNEKLLLEEGVDYDQLIYYIIYNLSIEYDERYLFVIDSLSRNFYKKFLRESLKVLKLFFDYRCKDEINFAVALGSLIGDLTLARNRIITLDVFDFKSYLVKSIENRRILFSITFMCNFLKQGEKGLIFKPKNPWLMSLLDLLGELYSCTLKPVRKEIENLFTVFSVPLISKPSHSFKLKVTDYLSNYIIDETDPTLKHVISLALDLSVREISSPIVEKACGIAIKSGMVLFKTIVIDKDSEYVLFRNMVINLTRSLCYISAQEPMKACISGNLSYFMKLCSLEFSTDKVYKIAMDNQGLCCDLVQRAALSKVNEIINKCYSTLEFTLGNSILYKNLSILEPPIQMEKINVKPIESNEYTEIKNHLIQIGKKTISKKNFITEEWHELFGNEREKVFEKIMNNIKLSDEKDEECIKLCKYITGHLIKSNIQNNFLFECMKAIFKISNKTQKEVLGWLIYSNDPRKFSISLVSKFIEHNLINIIEYDQALSKMVLTETNLDFVINLLDTLIISDIQICTVYDFICTLETLANHSDNNKVFDFFQKISSLMINLETLGANEYDEYIRHSTFTTVPQNYLPELMIKLNYPQTLNIKAAFKVSWDHFIRHHKIPTSYCYLKIDALPELIKDKLYESLRESILVFLEAYKKKSYLFSILYTRFIIKVLDIIEDNHINRSLIYSFIEILVPSRIPAFTSSFIEIMKHKFMKKYLDSELGVFLSLELLKTGRYSKKLVYPITQFFTTNNLSFMKSYSSYFSYVCPEEFPHLKNYFNSFRDRPIQVETPNTYFQLKNLISKKILKLQNVILSKEACLYLVDSLGELDDYTELVRMILKQIIEKDVFINEIIDLTWLRYKSSNAPKGLELFCKEICSFDIVRKRLDYLEREIYK